MKFLELNCHNVTLNYFSTAINQKPSSRVQQILRGLGLLGESKNANNLRTECPNKLKKLVEKYQVLIKNKEGQELKGIRKVNQLQE